MRDADPGGVTAAAPESDYGMCVRDEADVRLATVLRADAERNRRRILDVARAAFAEQGLDTSVADIRQRAGVGQGTIFRHFPTKEHLLAAVMADRLEEVVADTEKLFTEEGPGAAVHRFLVEHAMIKAEDRCLHDLLCQSSPVSDEVRAASARLFDLVGRLLARAQAAGEIRADVRPEDIMVLKAAAAQGIAALPDPPPELYLRYVDLIFDGLRPDGAHPLSHPPPTGEVQRMLTGGADPDAAT